MSAVSSRMGDEVNMSVRAGRATSLWVSCVAACAAIAFLALEALVLPELARTLAATWPSMSYLRWPLLIATIATMLPLHIGSGILCVVEWRVWRGIRSRRTSSTLASVSILNAATAISALVLLIWIAEETRGLGVPPGIGGAFLLLACGGAAAAGLVRYERGRVRNLSAA